MSSDDDFRRLASNDRWLRALKQHEDILSVIESLKHHQRIIEKTALRTSLETESAVSHIKALARDTKMALDAAASSIRQLDIAALVDTYRIGAHIAEIERAARISLTGAIDPFTFIKSSAAPAHYSPRADLALPDAFRVAARAIESLVGVDRLLRQNFPLPPPQVPVMRFQGLESMPAVRVARIAIQLPEFDTTFLGNLYKRLHQLHESGIAFEPAMAQVDKTIREQADQLPRTWVTYRGLFDLLYPILLLCFQLWLGQRLDERSSLELKQFIESQLRATEVRIAADTQSLKASSLHKSIRIVRYKCYLRLDRAAKSPIIGILYPNQLVEIHKVSGKWAYIEFFDYVNVVPKTGWVLKKCLLKLKP